MPRAHEPIAAQARMLADALAERHGLFATPGELAAGVVYHLAEEAPEQAKAIALCWYGVDLAALQQLVAARRWDTLAALFKPPSPEPRKHDRGYSAAGRELGKTPRAVHEAVARGFRTLLAWQLVQRERQH